MILSGELQAGERITEVGLSKQMGVSRTPVRGLLPILAADGFLDQVGKRGYCVRRFDPEKSLKELELRAILEGVAVSYMARSGASKQVLEQLEQCLQLGDRIFDKGYFTLDDDGRYGKMNAEFHRLIVDNCGSVTVINILKKFNSSPFIGPSVLVFDRIELDRAYVLLVRAHGQHHALFDAICRRDPSRAEAIFREHGNVQRQNLFPRLGAGDSSSSPNPLR